MPLTESSFNPASVTIELDRLRSRVIALENLVIAMLAQSTDPQLDSVREMATYISPRPGTKLHPLTVRAAAQMIRLVERSDYFRPPGMV
jgi:hypothetical protein